MACLFCRYWAPKEPDDHRVEREARRDGCSSDAFNQNDVVAYIRSHQRYPFGACLRMPEPKPVMASHVCGEIQLVVHDWNWGLSKNVPQVVPQDVNLRAWADRRLERAIRGTWEERQARDLEADNARLKQELANARKLSKSRLQRLQKKAKPAPTAPAPEAAPVVPLKWPEAAD